MSQRNPLMRLRDELTKVKESTVTSEGAKKAPVNAGTGYGVQAVLTDDVTGEYFAPSLLDRDNLSGSGFILA